MSQEQWGEVDAYLTGAVGASDAVVDAVLAASEAAGLPSIHVSPTQGKLLMLLAQMLSAKRILEIGTLGGYSTVWLARGLATNGTIVTLEVSAKHAEVAAKNFVHAGVSDRIDLRVGPALETLQRLHSEGQPAFDLVFIDADKAATADYFRWALRLTRPGSLIVVDNVVRKGAVADAASSDANVQGIHRFFDILATDDRVCATAIQTVGGKGYDGFALALVVDPAVGPR